MISRSGRGLARLCSCAVRQVNADGLAPVAGSTRQWLPFDDDYRQSVPLVMPTFVTFGLHRLSTGLGAHVSFQSFSSGAAGHDKTGNGEPPPWDGTASSVATSSVGGASDLAFGDNAAAGAAFSPEDVSALAEAAESAALAAAAAESWFLSSWCQQLLTWAHLTTGTSWWQSIILTTLLARCCTLPFVINQIKNTYNMTKAQPEIEALRKHYEEERERGNKNASADYQMRLAQLWAKHKCNPLKSLGNIVVQAPVFIGFFSALRALAEYKVPSMTHGGVLWFTDLTAADPYCALPVLSAGLLLLTVELGATDGMQGQNPATLARMKIFMRIVAVVTVPLMASFPQGVFVYWVTSNTWALAQSLVLKVPAVKRVLRLPDLAQARAAATPTGLPLPTGKPVLTFAAPPRKAGSAPAADLPTVASQAQAAWATRKARRAKRT